MKVTRSGKQKHRLLAAIEFITDGQRLWVMVEG